MRPLVYKCRLGCWHFRIGRTERTTWHVSAPMESMAAAHKAARQFMETHARKPHDSESTNG